MRSDRRLKNVKLEKVRVSGHDTWRLYHLDADETEWPDPYFDIFSEYLLPGEASGADATNTRRSYTRWVAHFIDFMIEAVSYEVEHGEQQLTGAALARLIRKYSKFLAEADESGDPLVAEVAKRLGAAVCSQETQSAYIAAVNRYLDLSEDFNATMRELGIKDIHGTPLYSETDLFPESIGKVALRREESIALNKNSMLAGVMSGGARMKRIAKLKPMKPVAKEGLNEGIDLEEFYQHDHFPFEHAPRLISEGFTSLRNKALFCLLMACGCRLHEALLLTWRDIDAERQLVRLRCPHTKSLADFGGFFRDRSEVLSLPWKGRTTERTALIEPFRTHFWRLLAEYQNSKEFTITNSHNFIFQVIKGESKGAPLIVSDRSNLADAMVRACTKIGVAPRRPHTLRHMYGVYCLNFIPFDDGTYGMGLLALKDLMGHASQTSTRRYAIPDTQLQMMRQKASFAAISGFSVDSSAEMRLVVMEKDYEKLAQAIAHEKKAFEKVRPKEVLELTTN